MHSSDRGHGAPAKHRASARTGKSRCGTLLELYHCEREFVLVWIHQLVRPVSDFKGFPGNKVDRLLLAIALAEKRASGANRDAADRV